MADNSAPQMDYMIPSQGFASGGSNSIASMLLENELDVGCLRPFIAHNGRHYITRNAVQPDGTIKQKAVPLVRNDATLRTLDWQQLDEAILKAAKPRLRAAADIEAAGCVYRLPNGIAKTMMQFQTQSDISPATISMDGLRQGESDRPVFGTVNFPLPLIHKDFQLPLREVLASRTGYSPLDTTNAELAGRRVMEQVEELVLGASSSNLTGAASYAYGGGTIQGYMNFTNRIAYTLTAPTAAGWTPQNTIDDILNMKKASQQAFHYGPWMVYFGTGWDPYMDDDYKPTYNDTSLRARIKMIDGIIDARTVDYMAGMDILLVQLTTDVVRMVTGLDLITIQWESHGGMQLNFKVLCMKLPQLRVDYNGNTGIVHGS